MKVGLPHYYVERVDCHTLDHSLAAHNKRNREAVSIRSNMASVILQSGAQLCCHIPSPVHHSWLRGTSFLSAQSLLLLLGPPGSIRLSNSHSSLGCACHISSGSEIDHFLQELTLSSGHLPRWTLAVTLVSLTESIAALD